MNSYPKVSVIVLNYNGKRFIANCLESLLKTNYPNFEVLVLDNASTDGSREWLMENSERFKEKNFKFVMLDRNYGYAKGNNIGIRLSDTKSKYVILLNNDTEVDPDWIKNAVDFLERHEEVGIAQCLLMSLRKRELIDSAGGVIDYTGRVLSVRNGERYHKEIPYKIFYAQGASIIIRRSLLKEIGLLDEDYFIYYEETDLCWRAWLRNKEVVVIPNAIVYHHGSVTKSGELPNPFILFHARKNNICTLLKNYSLYNAIKFSLLLYMRYFLFTIKVIFNRKMKNDLKIKVVKAYYGAMIYPLVNLRSLIQKRRIVQKDIRKNSDKEVMKRMIDIRVYESVRPQIVQRNLRLG